MYKHFLWICVNGGVFFCCPPSLSLIQFLFSFFAVVRNTKININSYFYCESITLEWQESTRNIHCWRIYRVDLYCAFVTFILSIFFLLLFILPTFWPHLTTPFFFITTPINVANNREKSLLLFLDFYSFCKFLSLSGLCVCLSVWGVRNNMYISLDGIVELSTPAL